MKRFLLLTVIALASRSFAQISPQEDFVLSGPTAYGMMNPEHVAAGMVTEMKWSDDGKYILLLNVDLGQPSVADVLTNRQAWMDAVQKIVIYDVARRESNVVWSSKLRYAQVSGLRWFAGSNRAVAVVTERLQTTDPAHPNPTRQHVWVLNAPKGAPQVVLTVAQDDGEPMIDLQVSPTKPIALVSSQWRSKTEAAGVAPDWHYQYRTVNAAGSLSSPFDLDSGAFFIGWQEDGVSPVLMRFGRGADKKIWRRQESLDLASGKLTPIKAFRPFTASPTKLPVSIQSGKGNASLEAKSRDLKSVWLLGQEKGSMALITADGTEVQLSPTLTGVAYISQGVAQVRPIVQIPKDLFLLALSAADKARIISNTKQVGLGIFMFAADNDDMFPSNQSDVEKMIGPYLKDTSIYSGFVYTFGGGLSTAIENPVETAIGYMPGPGGKAVLYADGHVKWQPDQ